MLSEFLPWLLKHNFLPFYGTYLEVITVDLLDFMNHLASNINTTKSTSVTPEAWCRTLSRYFWSFSSQALVYLRTTYAVIYIFWCWHVWTVRRLTLASSEHERETCTCVALLLPITKNSTACLPSNHRNSSLYLGSWFVIYLVLWPRMHSQIGLSEECYVSLSFKDGTNLNATSGVVDLHAKC